MKTCGLSERDLELAIKHGLVDVHGWEESRKQKEIAWLQMRRLAKFLAERDANPNALPTPSRVKFLHIWEGGNMKYPCVPCRSSDLYAAYVEWCAVKKEQPDDMTTFIKEVKRIGLSKKRVRIGQVQSTVIIPSGCWFVIQPHVDEFNRKLGNGGAK